MNTQDLAVIFSENIGNKLTVQLANGLISDIIRMQEKAADEHNTPADPAVTE